MTKKVRGSGGRHRRPGARPPSERAGIKRRPTSEVRLSQLEVAEDVAELIVEDRPVEAAHELEHTARTVRTHRVKAGSLLATRAATEYVYVAKDMRRILVVAALLLGVMIVLWLLLVVLKVVPLPFY